MEIAVLHYNFSLPCFFIACGQDSASSWQELSWQVPFSYASHKYTKELNIPYTFNLGELKIDIKTKLLT